jgi:hypothetical protein
VRLLGTDALLRAAWQKSSSLAHPKMLCGSAGAASQMMLDSLANSRAESLHLAFVFSVPSTVPTRCR